MTREGFIEGRRCAPMRLGRVLILGLGASGRAMVDYCLPLVGERVEALAIAAGARTDASEAFAAQAAAAGAHVAFGDDAVAELVAALPVREQNPAFDICVPSPGIPQSSALYASGAATSAETVSEVEFAWRESAADSRWAAVTGTNGKTTVASLVAHLMREAGTRAAAVGNIGDTCIAAVAAGRTDVYVAEVSSYQLASTRQFAPNAAALLNITPDHLHWHGTFEAYRDAKLKLLANLADIPGSVAVLDATNDIVRAEVRRLRALGDERGFAYVPLGTAEGLAGDMRARCGSHNAAFIAADDTLTVALGGREHALVRADELLIEGAHNAGNALAAAACALALGADEASVARGLRTFAPLEHRIEPCGSVAGVTCVNDSKATNVDATLKALASFPGTGVIALLGGDDKGTDLAPLVEAAHAHTRAVVCFGEAGSRFSEAFSGSVSEDFSVLRAAHLEDAFDAALAAARPGDVVLLSPACASFDEFGSFEERGRVFKALVAQRAARAEG
ncbi:MAG TPA: UDP-N-acetylmuramoyl-L-alanine--D-glutamate ligase [Candidatus Gordonibacter avicola]|nr:UDP-N-acetylmuramoyl-L-alanine--D-glutamate ligase [Candidatus Gordonibacter avicola]